jgi:hypothetical protein
VLPSLNVTGECREDLLQDGIWRCWPSRVFMAICEWVPIMPALILRPLTHSTITSSSGQRRGAHQQTTILADDLHVYASQPVMQVFRCLIVTTNCIHLLWLSAIQLHQLDAKVPESKGLE